ncbi:hypothetical protein FTX61_06385 [Nitriliruptoraceae bacterium ZYF776]|nr:hypothetical protein [Profundirhabdus halotolerans]
MFTRIRTDDSGAITVLTAVILLALMAASAVAVDVGRLAVASGDQQGATDRAALDAVLLLEDGTAPTPQQLLDTVGTSLGRNLGAAGGVSTDRLIDTAELVRCEAGGWRHLEGAETPNGVRVRTTSEVGSLFLPQTTASEVARHAVACAGEHTATVSAASTGARLDGGTVNLLLGGLLGGDAALDLVGWEGLAGAQVSLDALRLSLNTSVATVDGLLGADLSIAQLAELLVDAMQREGADVGVDVGLIDGLLNLPVDLGVPTITLGELLELSTETPTAALDAAVDVFDLLLAGAQLATSKVAAGVDLPEIEVPGLGALAVRLRVIEPPVIAIGPPGRITDADGTQRWRTAARTAQVRLDVRLPVGRATPTSAAEVLAVTDQHIADEIADLQQRVDEASRCSHMRGIIRDIESAVEDLEDQARALGLLSLVGGLLTGVLDLVGGLLGGILDGLACIGGLPNYVRERGQSALDDYANLLENLRDTEVPASSGGTIPALSVQAGGGEVALTDVACVGDGTATTHVTGSLADVRTTSWDPERAAQATVPVAPIELLDLDLAILRAKVSLRLDASLGDHVHPDVAFAGPFPAEPQRFGTSELGLGGLLRGVTPSVSGTHLLGLPIGDLVDGVVGLLWGTVTPLLGVLDDVLTPVVSLLGVEIGTVEARVLDINCAANRYLAQ